MKRRLKSLLLAFAMIISMGACKGNSKIEESSIPTENGLTESLAPNEEVEIVTTQPVPPSQEVTIEDTSKNFWLNDDPEIKDELAKIEKGEPFYFTYITEFMGPHGMTSGYGKMNEVFKQIVIDGKKCLVYANDEETILASGYNFLGMPFYLFGYDQASGGKDLESTYSGWVLPIYTYTGELDPYSNRRLYTYSLYDYEDFHLLLNNCTPDTEFFSYGVDTYGISGPIIPFYLRPLDPEYNGPDESNEATGYAVVIEKDGIKYLVDANDFSKIYYKDFTGIDMVEDELIIKNFRNEDGSGTELFIKAEDINAYYSDILVRGKRQ